MYDHKTEEGGRKGKKRMMCVWRCWRRVLFLRGGGARRGRGRWDRTQQVGKTIFGENMGLLMEGLEGEYLLTLSGQSFVMLPVCN